PREPVMRAKADHVVAGERSQPFAVVANLGAVAVQDFVDLFEIGLSVGANLLTSERRARFGLSSRIAHHGREIAHKKNRGMPLVLKVFQLAKHHGMAEVQVGRGGIDAEFHAQRLARRAGALDFGAQLLFANDFGGAFAQGCELLVGGAECRLRAHLMKWDRATPASGSTLRPSILNWPESTRLTASV